MLSVDFMWILVFLAIECVTLTEPGAVTVVCASRVRRVGDPFCTLSGSRSDYQIQVLCEMYSHNIIIMDVDTQ